MDIPARSSSSVRSSFDNETWEDARQGPGLGLGATEAGGEATGSLRMQETGQQQEQQEQEQPEQQRRPSDSPGSPAWTRQSSAAAGRPAYQAAHHATIHTPPRFAYHFDHQDADAGEEGSGSGSRSGSLHNSPASLAYGFAESSRSRAAGTTTTPTARRTMPVTRAVVGASTRDPFAYSADDAPVGQDDAAPVAIMQRPELNIERKNLATGTPMNTFGLLSSGTVQESQASAAAAAAEEEAAHGRVEARPGSDARLSPLPSQMIPRGASRRHSSDVSGTTRPLAGPVGRIQQEEVKRTAPVTHKRAATISAAAAPPAPKVDSPREEDEGMGPAEAAAPTTPQTPSQQQPAGKVKSNGERRMEKALSEYDIGKEIGEGSMGKVRLGFHKATGEKVAIKVVRRSTPEMHLQRPTKDAEGNLVPPTEAAKLKAIQKAKSMEVRTIREASISTLLNHPNICGMRNFILGPKEYYMILEHVDGGQLLDFIVVHGRLKERLARKLARQIGSALDYLHRNNVVHRDLKIENILIASECEIKIIDFGLSNLYDPSTLLSTYCGSLYFAAPELLNAKAYTGPEVDVWSFGIVLYVLLCGKVPFDDQNLPTLHAKIKKGYVEYPPYLTAEVQHLVSRMLTVDPKKRATLREVLSHQWLCRGEPGPPDNHYPHRRPLEQPLDPSITSAMTGFGFPPAAQLERDMLAILLDPLYKDACRRWWAKHYGTRARTDSVGSNESPRERRKASLSQSSSSTTIARRLSGLQLWPSSKSKTDSPKSANGTAVMPVNGGLFGASGLALFAETDNEALPDPTNGWSPLISIYYLVQERRQRDSVPGTGSNEDNGGAAVSISGVTLPSKPETALESDRGYDEAYTTRAAGGYVARSVTLPKSSKPRTTTQLAYSESPTKRSTTLDTPAGKLSAGQGPGSPLIGSNNGSPNLQGGPFVSPSTSMTNGSGSSTGANRLPSQSARKGFGAGLFSVRNTSTEPVPVVHARLIDALERLAIKYEDDGYEIRGFYEPSILLNASALGTPLTNLDLDGNLWHKSGLGATPSETLTVEFTIQVAKIPILGMTGLKLSRITGSSWTYKSVVNTILAEVKL